ncbi:MAG: T9SS type A sorting domain-containing protein, partial [Bacteroidales bacterium]|nr:T9SS type A sorting domain-containing protein [Bacteroidales bacterium]
NPFNLEAGAVDNTFALDLDVDASVAQPYGVYSVNVINGTVTSTVTIRLEINTVGVDNVAEELRTVAYPNPAQGAFAIRYAVEQPSTLTIVDMQGRTVRSMPVEGNGTVNVSDLPAGLYAYGIAGGKMQKLIVK